MIVLCNKVVDECYEEGGESFCCMLVVDIL